MKDALDAIDKNGDIHCVILTGAGRSFSSGHDTSEPQPDGEAWLSRHSPGRIHSEVCETLFRLRQPVIAAINGWCAGGALGLALCSDILIASMKTQSSTCLRSLTAIRVCRRWAPCSTSSSPSPGRKTSSSGGPRWTPRPRRRLDWSPGSSHPIKLMDEAWRTAEDIAEIPPDVMAMQREMMNRVWFNMGGPGRRVRLGTAHRDRRSFSPRLARARGRLEDESGQGSRPRLAAPAAGLIPQAAAAACFEHLRLDCVVFPLIRFLSRRLSSC